MTELTTLRPRRLLAMSPQGATLVEMDDESVVLFIQLHERARTTVDEGGMAGFNIDGPHHVDHVAIVGAGLYDMILAKLEELMLKDKH